MCRLTSHCQIYDLQLLKMVPAWEEDVWIQKTVKGRGGENRRRRRNKDGCEWRRKVGGEFLAAW